MKFYKKLAILGIVGIMTIGQCMPTFAVKASDYTYSAYKTGDSTPSQITTVLVGTMSGPSAYLSLTIRGIYTLRGSGNLVTAPYTNTNDRAMGVSISAKMSITRNVPGYEYYHSIRCSGMYKSTPTGTFESVGTRDITVWNDK